MCQKHPLKFAEGPDRQGSEANEAASLKFIVSEVSDGPKEVRWSLPSRGFRRKPSPRNDTSRLAVAGRRPPGGERGGVLVGRVETAKALAVGIEGVQLLGRHQADAWQGGDEV